MEEVWFDIKGYVGLYQISNKGRVNSTPRPGTRGGVIKWRKHSKYRLGKRKGMLFYEKNSPTVQLCKNGLIKDFTIGKLYTLTKERK